MTISPRQMRITLAAMTLSASMILVDQTAVPLASPDVRLNAAQHGEVPNFIKATLGDVLASHVDAFQVLYSVSAGIAVIGAAAAAFLIRKTDRIAEEGAPVLSRRSRWTYITPGSSSS